jgi:hypothetical protein
MIVTGRDADSGPADYHFYKCNKAIGREIEEIVKKEELAQA